MLMFVCVQTQTIYDEQDDGSMKVTVSSSSAFLGFSVLPPFAEVVCLTRVAVQDVLELVATLGKKEIEEIRKLGSPPQMVQNVVEVMATQ